MQTATDPLVGRLLDRRYRVLEPIARGGMSTVYSGIDERLDRRVAIKVMSPTLSSDPVFTDRFAREARAAARLSHVNVVSVHDQGMEYGPDGPSVFLIMELVDGRTLRDLIRQRGGRFSPAEAVSLMEPVLSALAAAHRAGLVHRDVKPENILLSAQGVVKVADFGLARAVNADAASTRTGLMMGTIAYCAPEQITRGAISPRSDVYAAGIVLFELLTGRPPYEGDSPMTVAYQHVHSRVPAPSSRVRGLPAELDEIVVAATDRDADGRPADAAALLAELADARVSLRLPVVPVPAQIRSAQPGRVHRTRTLDAMASKTMASNTTASNTMASDTMALDADAADQPTLAAARPDGRTSALRDVRHDTRIAAPRAPERRPARPTPRPPVRAGQRRRRTPAWLIALLILLIAAASVAAGVLAVHWFRSWSSHVPPVTNRSLPAAELLLRDDHYRIGTVSRSYSESVPKGTVIGTDPGSGQRLPQGSPVDLTVSLGKERFSVPRTTGLLPAAARQALAGIPVRIAAQVRHAASTTVPSGQVLDTSPAAGTSVRRGTVVTLVVSSGRPIVAVPNVVAGTPADQAAATIKKAGFAVVEVRAYSDTIAAGAVISVDPAQRARQSSTITITVSRGPHLVAVPQIGSGDPVGTAEAALRAVGLVPHVDRSYDGGVLGRVINIDPGAGTQVPVGSTVTLTVV